KAPPAIARDAPTRPDNKTRGSRIFQTMLIYIESTASDDNPGIILEKTICIILVNGTETVPMDVPKRIVKTTKMIKVMYAINLFSENIRINCFCKSLRSFY